MSRLRYIVSRDEPQLYEYLKREFSGDATVDVVLDRRGSSAPRPSEGSTIEPGESERRTHDVRTSIRTAGWALVWDRSPSPSQDASAH